MQVVSNYKITKSESYSQLKRCVSMLREVVSNYKITKSESYSQRMPRPCKPSKPLYLITKLQNLKAIHNEFPPGINGRFVVSNYKITKSESYSQLV